jgi:hypothetical protein
MSPCSAKFGSGHQISRILFSSISDSVYEHFDLLAVGENSCRSRRTSINRPLTGWNRNVEEEDVQISDYRVWSDTAKGEEGICKVS